MFTSNYDSFADYNIIGINMVSGHRFISRLEHCLCNK